VKCKAVRPIVTLFKIQKRIIIIIMNAAVYIDACCIWTLAVYGHLLYIETCCI